MALILSCLVDDSAQARSIIERLCRDGWMGQDITVLHPGESLLPEPTPEASEAAPQAAVVAGGSAAVAAGAFGWLIGYGVLALPAALLGAAVGSAAGAAIAAGADDEAGLRETLTKYYLPRINDGTGNATRAALLVRAQDAHGYDVVMRAFRAAGGKDIQVVGKGRMEAGESHDEAR